MANIAANNTPDIPWYDGDRINAALGAFNHWKDDFFIELSPILLMMGFIMGTIDVLTSGGIEQIPFISVVWAIMQAISIDGLFFAVWGRIRHFEWTGRTWFQGLMLILVGLLLSVVAALVNNILSFEELNHVSGVANVMGTLGIDAAYFSYGRSILVVIVALLVALFTKGRGISVKQLQATIDRLGEEISGLRSTRDSLSQEKTALQGQYTTLENQSIIDRETIDRLTRERSTLAQECEENRETIARLRRRAQPTGASSRAVVQAGAGELSASGQGQASAGETDAQAQGAGQDTSFIARDNGETISVSNGQETVYATGSYRDRIKVAMVAMQKSNQDIHYPTIAQSTGIGLSTIKKWGPEIKEEITQQSTQAMQAVTVTQEQ